MSYTKHYTVIKKGLKELGNNDLPLELSVPLYKKTKKEIDSIEGILRKLETDINKIALSNKFSKENDSLSNLINTSQQLIEQLQSETDPDSVVSIYTQIICKLRNAEHMVHNANVDLQTI